MDESLVLWVIMVFVFLWQQMCDFHCSGIFTLVLQWYSILLFGLGYVLYVTMQDFYKYDWVRFDYLQTQALENNTHMTSHQEDMRRIDTHPCLRMVCLLAPFGGCLAYLLVACHIMSNVVFGYKERKASTQASMEVIRECPWLRRERQDLVLQLLVMPAVFAVMALRSEIRMLAVMTGSTGTSHPGMSWQEVEHLEIASYRADLALACAFQYYTVWAFAHLCSSFLGNDRVLAQASLQGAHMYVLLGVVRTLYNFLLVVAKEHPQLSAIAEYVQAHEEEAGHLIGWGKFIPSVLCMYNMFLIAEVSSIKEQLPDLGTKLQATSFLVLISQMQLVALRSSNHALTFVLNWLQLSDEDFQGSYRTKLLHASLLNFECLLVAAINLCLWQNKFFVTKENDKIRQCFAFLRRKVRECFKFLGMTKEEGQHQEEGQGANGAEAPNDGYYYRLANGDGGLLASNGGLFP